MIIFTKKKNPHKINSPVFCFSIHAPAHTTSAPINAPRACSLSVTRLVSFLSCFPFYTFSLFLSFFPFFLFIQPPMTDLPAPSTKNRDDDNDRRFPHPNIVQVYGAYQEDGKLFMVMEYMSNSLRNKRVVNRVDIVRVLADVARALVRLHAAGHVHRDVKARNVLISKAGGGSCSSGGRSVFTQYVVFPRSN